MKITTDNTSGGQCIITENCIKHNIYSCKAYIITANITYLGFILVIVLILSNSFMELTDFKIIILFIFLLYYERIK